MPVSLHSSLSSSSLENQRPDSIWNSKLFFFSLSLNVSSRSACLQTRVPRPRQWNQPGKPASHVHEGSERRRRVANKLQSRGQRVLSHSLSSRVSVCQSVTSSGLLTVVPDVARIDARGVNDRRSSDETSPEKPAEMDSKQVIVCQVSFAVCLSGRREEIPPFDCPNVQKCSNRHTRTESRKCIRCKSRTRRRRKAVAGVEDTVLGSQA